MKLVTTMTISNVGEVWITLTPGSNSDPLSQFPFRRARGMAYLIGETVTVTLADEPIDGPDGVPASVAMVWVNEHRKNFEFRSERKPAQVERVYVQKRWLAERGDRDTLHMYVPAGPPPDDDTVFLRFLEHFVYEKPGGRLTSGAIWARWCRLHGADPSESMVGGIKRASIWRYLRALFPMPEAKGPARVTVGGDPERYWPGYTMRERKTSGTK